MAPHLSAVHKAWWRHAPQLSTALSSQGHRPMSAAHYQFADALLELDVDDLGFYQRFQQAYGECAIAPQAMRTTHTRVRCTVRRLAESHAVWFAFDDSDRLDLVDFSLRVMPGRGYGEIPSELEGWRFLAHPANPGVPFMVAQGQQGFVDLCQPWHTFIGSCAVNRVLRQQPEVLFLHAASIGLGDVGTLLLGPKGAGKSTTALTLAARGQPFLGDEIAAVRRSTRELVPVRRSASIRPGPRAQAVELALQNGACLPEVYPDGSTRLRAPVQELFPDAVACCLPLQQALFLRHFAPRPRLEPFTFTLHHVGRLEPLSCTLWGVAPGSQLMALLALFTQLRCYFLDLGEPDATADLLESLREIR